MPIRFHLHGDQLQFKEYKYWLLRSIDNNNLRFVAGTGQIFAVVELEGKSFTSSSSNINVMFPNEQTSTVLSVLADIKAEDIEIELYDGYILIDASIMKIKIVQSDASVQWPDENKFCKDPVNITLQQKLVTGKMQSKEFWQPIMMSIENKTKSIIVLCL
jgi:hypothetical protein